MPLTAEGKRITLVLPHVHDHMQPQEMTLENRRFLVPLASRALLFVLPLLAVLACQEARRPATEETTAAVAPSDRRPNLILILADDLGYGDVGINGSERIKTPAIDALGRSGVHFTSGYVAAAVCSPSRAALMTGLYPGRLGYEFNFSDPENYGLPLDQPTLASRLKEVGYTTGIVGKWQLGPKPEQHPLSKGFDEFFGFMFATSYIAPDTQGVENWNMDRGVGDGRDQRPLFRGREVVKESEYLTEVLTREALSFLDRNHSEPFFLYLAHWAPHTPLQATKQYLDRYRHVEADNQRIFAAMVSALDDGVGAVVAKLEELGVAENTMVAFLSDNGCGLYTRGACTNQPLAGGKRYHWEGGVRVPFLLSWPAAIRGGITYDEPVISMDLHATFLEAGGVATRDLGLDGVDLVPYLNDPDSGSPHDSLYWRAGPNHAVRNGSWKLWTVNKTTPEALASITTVDGLRPDFVAPKDSPLGQLQLLYDLSTDLGERHSVAAGHPEVVERLEAAWAEWNERNREPMWNSNRGTVLEIDGVPVELMF